MDDTLKLALRLMIFTLIAGLALALTNEVTKGPIRSQAEAKAILARKEVLPAADAFEAYEGWDIEKYPDIDEVYIAKSGGETVGYTFLLSPRGYKADITMTLGISSDGSINALYINSQSETAGLGNLVAKAPFLSQFSGIAADPDTIDGDIDAISGATVSSKAVIRSVSTASAFVCEVFGGEGGSGT